MIYLKVLKYKKGSGGKYIVYLDDNSELSLYEDVILKYDLLIKKNIDSSIKEDILNDNLKWDVYYVALKCLKARMRSIHELRELLIKKEYPIDLIDIALNKLIEQGYLNDEVYARTYINNQIVTSSRGPLKIKYDLNNSGVDNKIIDKEILVFSEDEQVGKIKKIIEKAIKSNHSRGGEVLKRKIINDLNTLGYEVSIINKVISDYSFVNDNDIARKEYEKLKKKLERKYSGNELKNKIRERMYMKGLKYDEED